MIKINLTVFYIVLFCDFSLEALLPNNEYEFPIHMPGIHPTLPNSESYLCTGVAVPNQNLYITGFQPEADMSRVHHMMLVGCDAPVDMNLVDNNNVWNCGGSLSEPGISSPGSACPGSNASQTLFMWSLGADGIHMPEDTSVPVGLDTNIKHLVLQVHYYSTLGLEEDGDWSGLKVSYTNQQTSKVAGVMSLHVHGVIPPESKIAWDSLCQVGGTADLEAFAYLGHTHRLGKLVSGWKIEELDNWTQLGRSDPRHPQAFLPVDNVKMSPGDVLAARCIFENYGLTSKMEMCDIFIYFSVDLESMNLQDAAASGKLEAIGQQCTNQGPPEFSWESFGLEYIPEESILYLE